jgi:hypothetical protein
MSEDPRVKIIEGDVQQLGPEPPSWASFACDEAVAEWNVRLLAGQLAQLIYDEIGPETAAFLDRALFRTPCLNEVIAALRKRVQWHGAETPTANTTKPEPARKPTAGPTVAPTVPKPESQLEPGFPNLPEFLERANPACVFDQPVLQINSKAVH